jgi:hypothetical protein
MDSAFWYGLNRSQAGRHSRQIAAWEDYAEDLQDTANALEEQLRAAKREGADHARLEREYRVIAKVLTDTLNKACAERNAIAKDANEKIRTLNLQCAVETSQKVFFQNLFLLVLDYVPGLKDDLSRASSKDITNVAFQAYVDALRERGVTPEMLEQLKETGYNFVEPLRFYGDAASTAHAEGEKPPAPTRKFVSQETIQLKGKVDDLRTKYNKLVADHNDLAENRLLWAYQGAVSQAEAEGHKAVPDLYRNPPPNADIDAPNSDIPSPEGQCDSLASAAFRRAFASYLLEQQASKEDLARFAVEARYEFPFPVVEYMDWIAAETQEDVPCECPPPPPPGVISGV